MRPYGGVAAAARAAVRLRSSASCKVTPTGGVIGRVFCFLTLWGFGQQLCDVLAEVYQLAHSR